MAASKSGGARKYGRSKRKAAAKSGPMSRYVRGLITWKQYNSLTSGGKRKSNRSFHISG